MHSNGHVRTARCQSHLSAKSRLAMTMHEIKEKAENVCRVFDVGTVARDDLASSLNFESK